MAQPKPDNEPDQDESPDYLRQAAMLAPLYDLFRAIARRVAAEHAERSSSEANPRP